jgi:hypothetical protein
MNRPEGWYQSRYQKHFWLYWRNNSIYLCLNSGSDILVDKIKPYLPLGKELEDLFKECSNFYDQALLKENPIKNLFYFNSERAIKLWSSIDLFDLKLSASIDTVVNPGFDWMELL